jgi:hypothetical protein
MGSAPSGTTFFGHLEALGAPRGPGLRLAQAVASSLLLIAALLLLLGACAFAFGPSRTLFDRTLLPEVLGGLLFLCLLHRLAGPGGTRGSTPARLGLGLVFLVGAFCFVNEAWSFFRRAF